MQMLHDQKQYIYKVYNIKINISFKMNMTFAYTYVYSNEIT